MPQREGSVFLYLFVVAMVLFLLSTVAFFMEYNESETLKKDLRDARSERRATDESNRKYLEDLNDLRALVAGRAAAEGEFPPLADLERNELKGKAEVAINAAMKDLGRQPATLKHLVEPYGLIEDIVQRYQSQRDTAYKDLETARVEFEQGIKAKDDTITDLRGQLQSLRNELAAAQQKWEEAERKGKQEAQRLVEELETAREESADRELQLLRKLRQVSNERDSILARLEKLESETRKEKTFDDIEPDGRLLNVATALGKGWIDLGRRNHLTAGLVFRVFQPVKGGKKLYKGRVEVRKVEEEIAEVRIVEEANPLLHPITSGDFVSSPFYDPKAKPVLVFAGSGFQSQDVTEDYLKTKLRTYGVEISETVDTNTTFLVALKNYQDTTEYRQAQELGVTVLRESDLLEFIGQ